MRKKILFFISIAISLIFLGCSKENTTLKVVCMFKNSSSETYKPDAGSDVWVFSPETANQVDYDKMDYLSAIGGQLIDKSGNKINVTAKYSATCDINGEAKISLKSGIWLVLIKSENKLKYYSLGLETIPDEGLIITKKFY